MFERERQKSLAEIEAQMYAAREGDRQKGFDSYDRDNCPILFPEVEEKIKREHCLLGYGQFGWAIYPEGGCGTASCVFAAMVDLEAMLHRDDEIKELKKVLAENLQYARLQFLEKQKRGEFLNVDSP